MPQPDHEFQHEHIPFGYLITFRAYGTWLHGKRGSVDRFHNLFGEPKLPANEQRRQYNQRLLSHRPVKLGSNARKSIESAIRETCKIRGWDLWAFNVRTNHVHTVVSANTGPTQALSALKANAHGCCVKPAFGEAKEAHGLVRAVSVIFGLSKN